MSNQSAAKMPFGWAGVADDIAKLGVFVTAPESDWITG